MCVLELEVVILQDASDQQHLQARVIVRLPDLLRDLFLGVSDRRAKRPDLFLGVCDRSSARLIR